MKELTIKKAENGFTLTDGKRTWIANSRYDISEVCIKFFNENLPEETD